MHLGRHGSEHNKGQQDLDNNEKAADYPTLAGGNTGDDGLDEVCNGLCNLAGRTRRVRSRSRTLGIFAVGCFWHITHTPSGRLCTDGKFGREANPQTLPLCAGLSTGNARYFLRVGGRRDGMGAGSGTFCAFLSLRSSPKLGCSYVPDIRIGTTSPFFFFLKKGSITFNSKALAPLSVFEIFESTCIWPCRSIL